MGENIVKVLGVPFHNLKLDQAIVKISEWAQNKQSKYVCFTNVHATIEANYDRNFHNVLDNANLVCPDGAPIAWMMRKLGYKGQKRVCGPDLFWRYCGHAELTGESIFLYGSEDETIKMLTKKINISFPNLKIAGSYSPPYRYINHIESDAIIDLINQSGANTVWVSLGCPKQEVWMANHCEKINAVLLGVGAAFNFHAGTHQRAPIWMRVNGLEWLHRLYSDPVRLWKRYTITNSVFLIKSLKQLVKHKLFR